MTSASHKRCITSIERNLSLFSLEHIQQFQRNFKHVGFVKIPNLLSPRDVTNLSDECLEICSSLGKNKNMEMKSTQNTPRIMRTVGQHILAKESKTIPQIYASEALRDFIGSIVGEPVFQAPWDPEKFVLSYLHREGDTHGWHWDDYSYAFVLYLKAPAIDQGGFVQTCAGGIWDKRQPKVFETILNGAIRTHRCEAGDAYILHASKQLHRVTPITRGGDRLIVNMTWASKADLERDMTHETNDLLFAN